MSGLQGQGYSELGPRADGANTQPTPERPHVEPVADRVETCISWRDDVIGVVWGLLFLIVGWGGYIVVDGNQPDSLLRDLGRQQTAPAVQCEWIRESISDFSFRAVACADSDAAFVRAVAKACAAPSRPKRAEAFVRLDAHGNVETPRCPR